MSHVSIINSSHPIRTATIAAGAVALAGVAATAALVLAVKLWAPPLLAVSAHHSAVVFLVSPAGLGFVAGAGLALTALIAVAVFAELATRSTGAKFSLSSSDPAASTSSDPTASVIHKSVTCAQWADRINARKEGNTQVQLTQVEPQPALLESYQEVYDVSLADADGGNQIRFRLLLEVDESRVKKVHLHGIYQGEQAHDFPAVPHRPSRFDPNGPIEEQQQNLVLMGQECERLQRSNERLVVALQQMVDKDHLIGDKTCLNLQSYQFDSAGGQHRCSPLRLCPLVSGETVYTSWIVSQDRDGVRFSWHTKDMLTGESWHIGLLENAQPDHLTWIKFKRAIGLPVPAQFTSTS